MSYKDRLIQTGRKAMIIKMIAQKINELEDQGYYEEITTMMDRIVIL